MKLFVKKFLLAALFAGLFGCASNGSFETRLAPPEDFNPMFMKYKNLGGQKAMVVAVDPGGHWAFGYEHDRATIEEAIENATIMCDEARRKHKIFTKAKVFATNNDIVYYDQFK